MKLTRRPIRFFMLGFFIPFIIFGAIFVGGAVFIAYGIVGAIMTFQGKDFHYILVGKRLASYVDKSNSETSGKVPLK